MVVMSGVIPNRCCAPPGDHRNPVMTSSKIKMVFVASGYLTQILQEILLEGNQRPRTAARLDNDGGDIALCQSLL